MRLFVLFFWEGGGDKEQRFEINILPFLIKNVFPNIAPVRLCFFCSSYKKKGQPEVIKRNKNAPRCILLYTHTALCCALGCFFVWAVFALGEPSPCLRIRSPAAPWMGRLVLSSGRRKIVLCIVLLGFRENPVKISLRSSFWASGSVHAAPKTIFALMMSAKTNM